MVSKACRRNCVKHNWPGQLECDRFMEDHNLSVAGVLQKAKFAKIKLKFGEMNHYLNIVFTVLQPCNGRKHFLMLSYFTSGLFLIRLP